jgi:hypothetical protein
VQRASQLRQDVVEVEQAIQRIQDKSESGQGMSLLPLPWLDHVQEVQPTAKRLPEQDEADKIVQQIRDEQQKRDLQRQDDVLKQQREIGDATVKAQKDVEERITRDTEEELKQRADASANVRDYTRSQEEALQQQLFDIKQQGSLAAQSLLTAYGGKYAAFAKAILAVEKAQAIASAIINTKEAVTKVLAKYPPPFSYALAAGVVAYGAAQVAAIASTVIGGGSNSPSAGSPHNPIYTEPAADTGGGTVAAIPDQQAIQVIVNGNLYGNREAFDQLWGQFFDRINNKNGQLMMPTSRNAKDIVASNVAKPG